ncbi:MAG TPA: OmpA family protein [Abditibacteriaceae bacterium]|jgi:outer membrane protein OmpA-like peptidoglycan-associated protein
MRVTPLGKLLVLILTIGAVAGIWRYWNKLAPKAAEKPSVAVTKIELPESNVPSTATTAVATGTAGGCSDKPEVRLLGYAWNAQMGMHLANGGARAARGSIMCRNGVNLAFARQDDNAKLQEALVAFATELKRGNPNPTKGAHFMTMMGDGSAAFLAGLNDALKRLGPEYQAKIVGAIGYSRGEDKFMGPQDWKADPETSKGGVVAGYLRDGDWNIAQKWLGDNGLRTNPDEKTWDPDALNWVAANDYIDAAEKYVSGYTETRPVVRDGKRTGETKKISVQGVVTWTPGDVTVAEKKGGLVSIISTKEYASQMPCVVIGIDKWMKSNRSTVESMLLSIAEGSDLVKSSPAALKRAAKISADVYKEEGADAAYWEKYFNVVQVVDAQGLTVELGGSSVNNLADSMVAFGLVPGSANLVGATYTVFGDLVKSQYPELLPGFAPADSVIDTTYLRRAAQRSSLSPAVIAKAKPSYRPRVAANNSGNNGGAKRSGGVLSRRSWNITFNPSSAALTPAARRTMEQLSRELLVAGGVVIEVHGHTDNQGNNPGKSWALSKQRSQAIKNWLERRAPVNFPAGRIQAIPHGEEQPLVRANNPQAWAKNRRVEIVLKAA